MKLDQSSHITVLPVTFYAHEIGFNSDCHNPKSYSVVFEAVIKEHIEMFISGQRPSKLPLSAEISKHFENLWDIFQKNGIDSADFLTPKAMYLSEAGNALIELNSSFRYAKEIEKSANTWWEITLSNPDSGNSEKGNCTLQVSGVYSAEGPFSYEIKPVSKETEQKLYKLYTPYIDGKNSGQYSDITEKASDRFGTIFNTTTFSQVQLLFVGAGLCCRVLDGAGNPSFYFDIGSGATVNAVQTAQQAASVATVVNDLTNNNLDIFISHWHTDHTQILNNNVGLLGINDRVCCPDFPPAPHNWPLAHAIAIQGQLQAVAVLFGVPVNLFVLPYASANAVNSLFVNPRCVRVKIDRVDTGNAHPHDHGIFVILSLTNANTVFLAGDCHYDIIGNDQGVGLSRITGCPLLTNIGAGYNRLVASHHGGKYTRTSGAAKSNYIPSPAGGMGIVYYSANGVTYHHPVAANILTYTGIGWGNGGGINRTDNIPAINNRIVIL